jgi:hypothetical protein
MTEMKFSLKRETTRVILEDEGGTKTAYLLRELTGKQRDDYQKTIVKAIKPNAEGIPQKLDGMSGLKTQLLVASMVREAGLEPVSIGEIDSFPSSVHEDLFDEAQRLSRLGKYEAEDDEGNG